MSIVKFTTSQLFKTLVLFLSILALLSHPGENYSPSVLKIGVGIPTITLLFLIWMYRFKDGEALLYKSNLYYPMLGFVVWVIISNIWSVNNYFALLMVFQFLSYFIVFILVRNLVANIGGVNFIIYSFVTAGVVVSIIGLLQFYFESVETIQNFFTQGAWPGSTFGNKNFSMHLIVMTLPLALIGILSSDSKKIVWLFGFSIFIHACYWVFSFTRAAWIAVFVQILILIMFFLMDYLKNKDQCVFCKIKFKKLKIFVFLFTVLTTVLTVSLSISSGKTQDDVIKRVQSISISEGSTRIPGWLNTLEMIKDHPFTGVGSGQWPIYYPLYHDKSGYDRLFNEKEKLTSLHNDYLEMLANFGAIGYIFLIWISVVVVRNITKLLLVSNSDKLYTLGISLSMIGFLVVSFFSFPIKSYYPALLLFSLLGCLSFLYQSNFGQANNKYIYKLYKYQARLLILIVTCIFLFVSYFSYNLVMAEKYREYAYATERENYHNLTLFFATEAMSYIEDTPDLYNLIGSSYLGLGRYNDSIKALNKSLEKTPYQANALFNLSLAYRKNQDYKKELKILKKLTQVYPGNFRAHAAMVRIYYKYGDTDSSNNSYRKMKEYFQLQKSRPGFLPHYSIVGRTAILVKDIEFAKTVYIEFLKKDPSAKNFQILGSLYLKSSDATDKAKGVDLFVRALKINPSIENNQLMIQEINSFKSEYLGN